MCTSCAAAPSIVCPPGFRKTTTNVECRYTVEIGDRLLELPGCSRSCEKVTSTKRCCPGFWGPLCLPCPSWSGKMCNWHGACSEGASGNGTCACEVFQFTMLLSIIYSCVNGQCNSGPDGDGQCYCQPPYSGPKCDKVLSSNFLFLFEHLFGLFSGICSPNTCDVNAECSYKGYEGNANPCTPINRCSQNNGGCPANSTVCQYAGPGKVSFGFHSDCTQFIGQSAGSFYNMIFSTVTLLQNCGAPMPLTGPGPLTVFIPTNKAVDRFRDGSLIYMLTDARHKLQELLRHHMFSQVTVDQVASMSEIQTMARQVITINATGDGRVLLGEKGIPLVSKDIIASNGIIHLIDGVLVPPSIMPIMPHRCDVNISTIVMSPCVTCIHISETHCPPGSVELVNYFLTIFRNAAHVCAVNCCRGFYGPDCKPCIGGFQNPCYNKGTCSDGILGDGTCRCNSGFTGIGCHICSNPNKHGENCDEDCRCVHGICDNRPGSLGLCRRDSCLPGFSGELCDQADTPCNSDGAFQRCHIHAHCTYANGQTTCVCSPGYEGDGYSCAEANLCLKPDRGGCHTNVRLSIIIRIITGQISAPVSTFISRLMCFFLQARCVYAGPGNVSCVCNEGWMGDGVLCVEVNNCLLESRGGCHENAECTSTGPGQVMRHHVISSNDNDHFCCPGYFGHDCFKCPGTVDNWCSNNGRCLDGLFGSGECLCNEGFHGTACETCEAGRYGWPLCFSECHCEHGKCLDGLDGNGWCICYKGWKGINCSVGGSGGKPNCVCIAGYQGNGTCWCEVFQSALFLMTVIISIELDLCGINNGGCSEHATCTRTSPGERSCTCNVSYTGDGIVCLVRIKTGTHRGIFTDRHFHIFKPFSEQIEAWTNKSRSQDLLRYHFVGCEELSGLELRSVTRVLAASGHMLRFSVKDGIIYINNKTKIITSDYECSNGVIHFIDSVLFPYGLEDKPTALNITSAAEAYGYTMFSKLLQKADLMNLVQHTQFFPFTMFWPTDNAFNSLPEEQKTWLYSEDHHDKLQAFIKIHIIRDQRVIASALTVEHSVRTMYGAHLTFSCDKDLIGNILINGNDAKIIDRHLLFSSGIAHGIDKVLEPPNIGAHCDDFVSTEIKNKTSFCRLPWRYGHRRYSVFDDMAGYSSNPFHYRPYHGGCSRVCNTKTWRSKCCKNHYGRDCQGETNNLLSLLTDLPVRNYNMNICVLAACNCTANGKCDEGLDGNGSCFCQESWTGTWCESKIEVKPVCSPECNSNAVCRPENQCECVPPYEGNGFNCTAPDLCSEYNGGCHAEANSGYTGDGNLCSPINRCVEEVNGGCSDFADCIVTGPNERRCECQVGYVGNGVQCLEKVVPPVDRCLEDNGGCHPKATCKDLHFHTKTAGVFHLRSPAGKYKMNYTTAEAACRAEEATLATLSQLSDAQQLGMHLCTAGWMDGKKVGYPIRFPSVKCGDNHVGIVLYKDPVDLSSPYDAYCYRVRDVECECGPGYIGNGEFCNGNLASVIATNSNFSVFYSVSSLNLSPVHNHINTGLFSTAGPNGYFTSAIPFCAVADPLRLGGRNCWKAWGEVLREPGEMAALWPVMVFTPSQTSLMLFSFSFCSTFLL
uniref:Stabilin 1 n=1 Tax=Astyanax mexicanus TaxID=7994 RepID=A0A3B1JHQ2_ASTMX